jgi:hypothetical protein
VSAAVQQPALTLDAESHVYRLGERVLPGVTDILVGAGIVDTTWFTELGKWRGSAVHLACWYDDEGDLDEAQLDPRLHSYLAAYRKFKAETGFTASSIEQPLHNDLLGYAGTPDRVGTLGDGRPCLPDLKSGASSKATRFQTVAYAACLPSPRRFVRMEVRLKENGKYSLQVYEPKDYVRDFSRWQSIVDVFFLRKEMRLI